MEPEFGVGGGGVGEETGALEQSGHGFRRGRGEAQRTAVAGELLPGGANELDETQIDLGKVREIQRDVLAFFEDGEKMSPEFGGRAHGNRLRNIYELLHDDPADDAPRPRRYLQASRGFHLPL